LQIKSLFSKIWVEVEHITIYKSRHYDTNEASRKKITEEIFNILDASDKQLVEMYSNSNSIVNLTKTLFYYQTYQNIQLKFNTDILSVHYKRFFEIFNDYNYTSLINNYVAKTLLNLEHSKLKVCSSTDSDVLEVEKEILKLSKYDLEILFEISSIFFIFNDCLEFINFFAQHIVNQIRSNQDEMVPKDYIDAFKEEEDDSLGFMGQCIQHLKVIFNIKEKYGN